MDFGKMIRKGPSHHDFADVMHQTGHIIRIIGGPRHIGRHFPGHQAVPMQCCQNSRQGNLHCRVSR